MKLYGMHGAGQIICALIIEELGLECEAVFVDTAFRDRAAFRAHLALWPGAGARA